MLDKNQNDYALTIVVKVRDEQSFKYNFDRNLKIIMS